MRDETEQALAWAETPPHPWRRLFARLCDYSIFQTLFSNLIYAAASPLIIERLNALRSGRVGIQMFWLATAFLSSLPIALLIAKTGTSPGKWCFGMRVVRKDGRHLSFLLALGREMRALFLGMGGMVVPFVLIAGAIAHSRLANRGEASWDASLATRVLYRRNPALKAALGILIIVLPYAAAAGLYFLA